MQTLLLATTNGLFSLTKTAQGLRPPVHRLPGTEITCIWSYGDHWLAGTPTGLLRSLDGGQTWSPANDGLTLPHVRTIAAPAGQAQRIFVGVEPAAIFVSEDGGLSWQECPEVAQLRKQYGWYLPYSENLGCVRSFAFHGERAYAAVEVGGLLRSDDGGRHWRLAAGSDRRPHTEAAPPYPLIHPDVHSVVVAPAAPENVWAATHGGLYHSQDGGATWQRRSKDCYCRALWLDPDNPQHLVFGPATRQEWNGHIEESFDGGITWLAATQGLAAPWEGAPIEQMIADAESLFALRDDGQLLVRFHDDPEWRHILPQLAGMQAIAVASDLTSQVDEAEGWQAYYLSRRGRPPRPLFTEAVARFAAPRPGEPPRLAIDLGCGDGTETLALLTAGWRVLALDGQPAAIAAVGALVPADLATQLQTQVVEFKDVVLPSADLIYAGFSLPFCPPAAFPALWAQIGAALPPGGRFAGQFFGERDSWNNGGELTFHTVSQVQGLLELFEIEKFQEVEEDGVAFSGPKHWHYFEVIARKKAGS